MYALVFVRFTWYELLECGNYDGDEKYTHVVESAEWVNLTGVLYVNIISPLTLGVLGRNRDTGYYRVYQQLSAPFFIAVSKTANVLSSVGIDLFIISIIGVYKQDADSEFKMVVLTESADFLQVSLPGLLSHPNIAGLAAPLEVRQTSINQGCLSAGFLCLQIWEISVNSVECPPTDVCFTLVF